MENPITVVGLRQNVLVLQAHAAFEIRMERYGTILRAGECHVRCFVVSHISLVTTLQLQICYCTGIVQNTFLPTNNTQYIGTVQKS